MLDSKTLTLIGGETVVGIKIHLKNDRKKTIQTNPLHLQLQTPNSSSQRTGMISENSLTRLCHGFQN